MTHGHFTHTHSYIPYHTTHTTYTHTHTHTQNQLGVESSLEMNALNYFAGDTNTLRTLVDGAVQNTPAPFPTGVNVTYICTVKSNGHTWTVPAVNNFREAILTTIPFISEPPFILRLLTQDSDVITSSLSFIMYPQINQSMVFCANSQRPDDEVQEATIIVIGKF